jgi:hypothetical protein
MQKLAHGVSTRKGRTANPSPISSIHSGDWHVMEHLNGMRPVNLITSLGSTTDSPSLQATWDPMGKLARLPHLRAADYREVIHIVRDDQVSIIQEVRLRVRGHIKSTKTIRPDDGRRMHRTGLDHEEDPYVGPRTAIRLGLCVAKGRPKEISLYASQVHGVLRAVDIRECPALNGIQCGRLGIFTRDWAK